MKKCIKIELRKLFIKKDNFILKFHSNERVIAELMKVELLNSHYETHKL